MMAASAYQRHASSFKNLPGYFEKLLEGKFVTYSSEKNDVSLFYRLFIACQNRDGDLDNFF